MEPKFKIKNGRVMIKTVWWKPYRYIATSWIHEQLRNFSWEKYDDN